MVSRYLVWILPIIAALVFFESFSAKIQAQTIFKNISREKIISLEILKPQFAGDVDTKILNSTVYLAARLPLDQGHYFVAELPFAHAGFNSRFGQDVSESTIGNPYAGIEIHNPASRLMWEIGLRVPLASERNAASSMGLITDFVDRMDAFMPKVFSLHGMVNYLYKDSPGLYLRFRGGPSGWIRTEREDGEERLELFLVYGMMVGYYSDPVRISGGPGGRWLITQDGDFNQNSVHQINFTANFLSGSIRPGISLRLPLDDNFSEILDFVFGLEVSFVFR